MTRTAVDLGRDAALAAAAPEIARRMTAAGFTRDRILQVVPHAVRAALTVSAAAPTPSPTPPVPPSVNSAFLDLDSMYGVEGYDELKDAPPLSGPVSGVTYANKYPGDFERDAAGTFTGRFAFRHVTSPTGSESPAPLIDSFDFIRMPTGMPIIPDPRNNENRVLAQLQALFMAAHNDCIDTLTSATAQRFNDCQRLVRWMYQTIVVTDYLPRVVDPTVLDSIAHTGGGSPESTTLPTGPITLALYSCQAADHSTANIGIPLEFAVAGFRLGHSQVRETYRLHQQVFDPQGELLAGEVRPIFSAPDGVSNAPGVSAVGLEAGNPLPSRDVIDWSFFFDINGTTEQPGRPLDAFIVERLFEMPVAALPPGNDPITSKDTPDERNLPRRNILRSAGPDPDGRLPGAVGLATGEEALARLAAAISNFDGHASSVIAVLSQKLLGQGFSPDDFGDKIPLWLWILAEAEFGQQSRLGGLGTHIVAEFIMGSLKCDQTSVVNQPATLPSPAAQWGPTNTIGTKHRYSLPDLIEYLQGHYKYLNANLVFSSR